MVYDPDDLYVVYTPGSGYGLSRPSLEKLCTSREQAENISMALSITSNPLLGVRIKHGVTSLRDFLTNLDSL